MRSVVNVLEARIKERQRAVGTVAGRLGDAKTLLERAVRIKRQQDLLLPLFLRAAEGGHAAVDPTKVSRLEGGGAEGEGGGDENLPSECPLNFLILALLSLSKGTFEQKFKLFLQIYYRPEESSRGKGGGGLYSDAGATASASAGTAATTTATATTATATTTAEKAAPLLVHAQALRKMTFNMRFLQLMVTNFHHTLHRIQCLPFAPRLVSYVYVYVYILYYIFYMCILLYVLYMIFYIIYIYYYIICIYY
jgi:hypothetical protein